MSGSIGKLCAYDIDKPGLQNQRTAKIIPHSKTAVDWKLVWLYLKTVEYQLKKKGKGLGISNVSSNDIESLLFKLPPLNERRRIVAKLEKLLHRVDACKERLDKIPAILKRFRQSVLASACSGRLTADWREKNPDVESAEKLLKKIRTERINTKTMPDFVNFPELPSNWLYATIGEVTNNIKYGTAQKCSYGKTGVPVLRIPNISGRSKELNNSLVPY